MTHLKANKSLIQESDKSSLYKKGILQRGRLLERKVKIMEKYGSMEAKEEQDKKELDNFINTVLKG